MKRIIDSNPHSELANLPYVYERMQVVKRYAREKDLPLPPIDHINQIPGATASEKDAITTGKNIMKYLSILGQVAVGGIFAATLGTASLPVAMAAAGLAEGLVLAGVIGGYSIVNYEEAKIVKKEESAAFTGYVLWLQTTPSVATKLNKDVPQVFGQRTINQCGDLGPNVCTGSPAGRGWGHSNSAGGGGSSPSSTAIIPSGGGQIARR